MPDPRTDEIAREAARLIETGRIDGLAQAIHQASHALGYHGVPLPGKGRVRKHAQAMAMQALGEEAYLKRRRRMWEVAEELLAAIDHALPEVNALLVGRAAEGHMDAGVTIHVRLYTRQALPEIVKTLVELGYGEPAFETADTRLGRLDQARFSDDDDFEVVLTRCLPEMFASRGVHLFTGEPLTIRTLAEVRRMMT
jgi:hypothetical protein